jgi:hypothetical protein
MRDSGLSTPLKRQFSPLNTVKRGLKDPEFTYDTNAWEVYGIILAVPPLPMG